MQYQKASCYWRTPQKEKPVYRPVEKPLTPLAELCMTNEANRETRLRYELKLTPLQVKEIRQSKGKAKDECRKYGITESYFNAVRRKAARRFAC